MRRHSRRCTRTVKLYYSRCRLHSYLRPTESSKSNSKHGLQTSWLKARTADKGIAQKSNPKVSRRAETRRCDSKLGSYMKQKCSLVQNAGPQEPSPQIYNLIFLKYKEILKINNKKRFSTFPECECVFV